MNHTLYQTEHWTVPAEHPVFAGHFPGAPILPGVMLLDIVLHTIATARNIALERCEISAVKFLSPAHPGDALAIQHTVAAGGTICFDIVALADQRKIASGAIAPFVPITIQIPGSPA
jgi:3-hydroxymyristoyl/3-hydroxydecanoyl-(acyl carrier protein) dehydratase